MRHDAPTTTPPSARRTARDVAPRRRRLLAGAVAALVVLTGAVGAAPAASAAPVRSPGSLTAGAYDYLTALPSDVVAGDPDTNLVVTFTARRALDDGTLTIALPTREWPDPLQVGDRLRPDDPTLRGSVVVRPAEAYDQLTDADCRATADQELFVTVSNTAAARTATVSHLSCAAGQSVTVRVFDVQAPRRAGRTLIVADVRDASGGAPSAVPLTVAPVPTTRLAVEPSNPVSALTGEPVDVTIRAIDTRGRTERTDTRYRGTVNVIALGTDCFVSSTPRLPVTFTAADRGVKTIQFSFSAPQTFRLKAYDVTKRALPGYSAGIVVSPRPDDTPSTCSRAYH